MSEYQPPPSTPHLVPPAPSPPNPSHEELQHQLRLMQLEVNNLKAELQSRPASPSSEPASPSKSASPSSGRASPSKSASPSSGRASPSKSASPKRDVRRVVPNWSGRGPVLPSSTDKSAEPPSERSSSGSEPVPPSSTPRSEPAKLPPDPVVSALLGMLTQLSTNAANQTAALSRADRELLTRLEEGQDKLLQQLTKGSPRSQSISELYSTRPELQQVLEDHRLETLRAIRRLPPAPSPELPSLLPVVRTSVVMATATTVFLLVTLLAMFFYAVTRGLL